MSNPAFNNSPVFNGRGGVAAASGKGLSATELDELYSRPSATPEQTDRMSYEDTIVKTVGLFGVLLVTAAVGWFIPALAIVGAIGGLILGFVNAFKKQPSVPLIVAYAAFEGLFVGGISSIFEAVWPGVVVQATIATVVTIAVVLALFASGKVRASAKATKVFLVAIIAYALFSLVNFGMMIFGADIAGGPFGLRSADIPGTDIPFGIVIGALAVLLAAYSLVLDFDFVKRGVESGAPRKFGWQAGFGIMVTVVWLYVEFLRIFAIARD
ncbi:hypothetical protein DDQ50_00420 [Amnibacterium flavum]|uniref:Bax inhibitor-1/YccA family protein n=1 Tax=Amnibacterium flavum TaxID=2173173 RepID=A0A2V1HWJ4_9MICO|nr:hypothetical protein DDQ50_00420 [Amnibacterium flavum]